MSYRPPIQFSGTPGVQRMGYRPRYSQPSQPSPQYGPQYSQPAQPHPQYGPQYSHPTPQPSQYVPRFNYIGTAEGHDQYHAYQPDQMQHISKDSTIKTYSNSPEVVLSMMRNDAIFNVVRTRPQYHVTVQLEGHEFLGVGASETDARTDAAKETMRRFFDMHHVPGTTPPAAKPAPVVDDKSPTPSKKMTKEKPEGKGKRKGRKGKTCKNESKQVHLVKTRLLKESEEDCESDDSDKSSIDRNTVSCKPESQKPLEYEEAENFIFEYLVEEFSGIISYTEFIEKCSPGKDIDNWLRKQRHRFHIFEDNDEILFIAPYLRDAAYCLDYTGTTRPKKCLKQNCDLIHICEHYMRGFCRKGTRCWKSHHYSDEHNLRVKQKLGLGTFRDAEISNILINRYPQVCPKRYCRGKKKCPYLHICRKYVIGKCTFKRCRIGHSLKKEQNAWVLKVYGMENIDDASVLDLVSIARLRNKNSGYYSDGSSVNDLESLGGDLSDASFSDTDSETNVDVHLLLPEIVSSIDRELPSAEKETRFLPKFAFSDQLYKAEKLQEQNGDYNTPLEGKGTNAGTICCYDVVGKCQQNTCRYLHTPYKMPYLWQAQTDGEWMSFSKKENENIEMHFCAKQDSIDSEIQFGSRLYKLHVHFNKECYGVVYKIADYAVQNGRQMTIRRLSTASYADMIKETCSWYELFCTQWRWYFKANINQWKVFGQDEHQSTLERKYLSNQRSYVYSKGVNEYTYCINFAAMEQVDLRSYRNRDLLRRPLYVSEDNVRQCKFPLTLRIDVPMESPSHWSPLDTSGVKYELVELDNDNLEFKKIQESFYTTLDEKCYDIDMIYRVQNQHLWDAYSVKKYTMRCNVGLLHDDQTVDERDLFYQADTLGTCFKIFTNSFESNSFARKTGFCYGDGAHFTLYSNLADTMANTNESKRLMIRAKVLVGNYTKGERSFQSPSKIPGKGHELFDSCVDDVTDPKIFVTFDRNQSFPEYLIQYIVKKESNKKYGTVSSTLDSIPVLPSITDSCSPPVTCKTAFEPSIKVPESSTSFTEVLKVIETGNNSCQKDFQELQIDEEAAPKPFPAQQLTTQKLPVIQPEPVNESCTSHEESDPRSVSSKEELNKMSLSIQEEPVSNVSSTTEKLIQKVFPIQGKLVKNSDSIQDDIIQKGDLSSAENATPTVTAAPVQLVSEVGIAKASSNMEVVDQNTGTPACLNRDSASYFSNSLQIEEKHFQEELACVEPHRCPNLGNVPYASMTTIDQSTEVWVLKPKNGETISELQKTSAGVMPTSEDNKVDASNQIIPQCDPYHPGADSRTFDTYQPGAESRTFVENEITTSDGGRSELERKPLANNKPKKGKNCRVQ